MKTDYDVTLKVGDLVRIVKNHYADYDYLIGKIGKVIEVDAGLPMYPPMLVEIEGKTYFCTFDEVAKYEEKK